jgi:hypothetical protein
MGLKTHHHRRTMMLGGMFLRRPNDLLMPEVQPIENTNRQGHGSGNGGELVE